MQPAIPLPPERPRERAPRDSSFFTYFLMLHFKSSIMPQVESTSFYPIVPFNRRARRFELLSVNSANGPFPDAGIYFVPAKRCFPTTEISTENRTINRVASALRVFVDPALSLVRGVAFQTIAPTARVTHDSSIPIPSARRASRRPSVFVFPSRRPCPLRFQSAIN